MYLDGLIPGPDQHEVHPDLPRGSRENVLYFTLPAAINFQRSSPVLWASALATWNDTGSRWAFLPESVCQLSRDDLQQALLRHRLAIQTHRHPAAWLALCESFHQHYGNDPRVFLDTCDFDVPTIVHALQHEKKHLFPSLRGIKLSNYWIFILAQFTDLPFQRLHELSIIPDTHVTRSTIELGLLSGTPTPLHVEQAWRSALQEIDIPPAEMHTALWRWSRNGFNPPIDPDSP